MLTRQRGWTSYLFKFGTRPRLAVVVSVAVVLLIVLAAVGVVRAAGGRSLPDTVPFGAEIEAAARRFGVDPCLLAAVVRQESNFDKNAIRHEPSLGTGPDGLPAASIGLAQVLVSTARDFRPGIGRPELFGVKTNLEVAAELISWLNKNGVTMPLGIDAYNMGIGNFRRGNRNFYYRDRVIRFKEELCK